MGEDLLLLNPRFLCRKRQNIEIALAQQRHQICLCGETLAIVGGSVHVNGQTWDHHQILIQIHQPGLYPFPGGNQNTPRNGERPVQPRGKDHAAVFIGIQLTVALRRHRGIVLEPEAGRVCMGCADHAAFQPLRHPKRNEAGLISGYIIPVPRLQLPCRRLCELFKARLFQHLCAGLYRLKAGRTLCNKIKQPLIQIFHNIVLLMDSN